MLLKLCDSSGQNVDIYTRFRIVSSVFCYECGEATYVSETSRGKKRPVLWGMTDVGGIYSSGNLMT